MIDTKLDVEVQAYDIAMFCLAHNISRALLYKMWAQDLGPRFFKAGNRTLISKEAAAEWRARLECEGGQDSPVLIQTRAIQDSPV